MGSRVIWIGWSCGGELGGRGVNPGCEGALGPSDCLPAVKQLPQPGRYMGTGRGVWNPQ